MRQYGLLKYGILLWHLYSLEEKRPSNNSLSHLRIDLFDPFNLGTADLHVSLTCTIINSSIVVLDHKIFIKYYATKLCVENVFTLSSLPIFTAALSPPILDEQNSSYNCSVMFVSDVQKGLYHCVFTVSFLQLT